MKRIYIVLGLLVIILVVCMFHSPTISEGFEANMISFLSGKELLEFILQDSDSYLFSLTQNDLRIRNATNISEYRNKIQKSFCDLDEYGKEKVTECISDINKRVISVDDKRLWGIEKQKLMDIPWKIGCTCNDDYENGFPHTRGDTIIIPFDRIQNSSEKDLCKLLIHEKIHVYQRLYYSEFQTKIKNYGFSTVGKRNQDPANPDLDSFRYKHEKKGEFYSYYSKNPKSFSDIKYIRGTSSSEHPFEYIAYDIERIFE